MRAGSKTKKKPNCIWVIEYKNRRGKWEPTEEVGTTENHGHQYLAWYDDDPKFRLRKYEAANGS